MIEQGSDDPIKNQDHSSGGQIEPERWRKQRRFAILDPAGTDRDAPENQKVYPTVYVQDELIIDRNRMSADVQSRLAQLAGDAGWTFNENGQLEDPIPTDIPDSPIPRIPGESNSVRIRLGIDADKGVVAATPDAWQLLRQARLNGIADGVSQGCCPQPVSKTATTGRLTAAGSRAGEGPRYVTGCMPPNPISA